MSYAVIATTEYYGPEIKRTLVSAHETEAEAKSAAEAYVSPDYDESVGCNRLAHNQASATRAEVAEIVRAGLGLLDDWSSLPADLVDAAQGYLDANPYEDEAMQSALVATGYAHLATGRDIDIEYLCKLRR